MYSSRIVVRELITITNNKHNYNLDKSGTRT